MSSNNEDDLYAPLPPKLPPKSRPREDGPIDYVVEERSPRKVQFFDERLDDEDAHPHVESPSRPRKRDSGKYYVPASRIGERIEGSRAEYERRRPDPEVQRLADDLARAQLERREAERERREAERAATAAAHEADRLKADLERERRQRSLEKRERAIAEREKRLSQERDHLVDSRRPRERRDSVVVVQNPPAVVPAPTANRSALDRARDDHWRIRQEERRDRDDRRPATSDGRPRRQSVIIINDERDRARDRGYGHW